MFLSLKKETKEYFQSWREKKYEALSELTVLTVSHCLHGREKVAHLCADLGGGFSHAACPLPGWLPLLSVSTEPIQRLRIFSI